MKTLWVTSFAEDMWKATGRRMVESFISSGSSGRLLCCTEGRVEVHSHPKVERFNLDEDLFLKRWLKNNESVIPKDMGGKYPGCRCGAGERPLHSKSKAHKVRCAGAWFNRNASRWFRKIVSLREALENHALETIIWVDSDCVFAKRVEDSDVDGWFGSAANFYFRSTRKVAETGIVGYRGKLGKELIHCMIELYLSQEYQQFERWDDSSMFEQALLRRPHVPTVDLATKVTGNAEVVPNSVVGPFIQHRKGHYGRKAKVMT